MNINRKGIKVVDSRRHLRVRVKPQDIKGAICADHQKCVIARALMRQTGAHWVDVGAGRVILALRKKTATRFVLNELAKEQVKFFDTHNGKFAPCKVQLYAPSKSVQLGYRKGDKARSGPSGRKAKHRTPPTR